MSRQGNVVMEKGDGDMSSYNTKSYVNKVQRSLVATKSAIRQESEKETSKSGRGKDIDVSELFVIRTGIRGYNDLSWIGSAANIAAKLSEIRSRGEKVFITDKVYDKMANSSKFGGKNNDCMWKDLNHNVNGKKIYGSDWYWYF